MLNEFDPGFSPEVLAAKVPSVERELFIISKMGAVTPRFINMFLMWVGNLSQPCYGGPWEQFELDNGGFFLAPATQEPLALEWRGNYSSEQVSAEAAGIVITLFALGHLSCNFPHYPKIAERYHQLRDYVGGHNEAAKIWRLID